VFSKFLSLEKDKQERIINAAIDEFAQRGYHHASTNKIIDRAKISKGILFHYFKSKKDLFLFLYDYSIELLASEIYESLDYEETDIFQKMRQSAKLKFNVFQRHPQMFNFIMRAYFEQAEEVKDALVIKNSSIIKENVNKFYLNFDKTRFREGIDPDKAVKLIYWSLEGFGNEIQSKLKYIDADQYETLLSEMEEYIKILEKCFYQL